MANIDVERKSGMPWIWIVLGLLVLALLLWWMLDGDEEEVGLAPVPEQVVVLEDPLPEPVAQGPLTTIASILGNPTGVIGQTFTSAAPLRVAEVTSDRGFWVEDQGERLFVVINEGAAGNLGEPQPADVQGTQAERPDVNAGDMVRIAEGVVHDASAPQSIQGPIDDETRQVLNTLSVFLVTDGRNIQKVEP